MRKLIMSKSMANPLSEQFRATHSQLDSYEDSYEEPVATLLVLPRYWRLNHLYKCSKSQATQKDQSMARPWFKWGSNGRVAAAHSHISWNRLDVLAFLIRKLVIVCHYVYHGHAHIGFLEAHSTSKYCRLCWKE